jgi:hypothetical protein
VHQLVPNRTVEHAAIANRPAWVREGAAIYFAGDRPIPGETTTGLAVRPEPRTSCPTDQELLQPISVGAMTNAYARARMCFARQIEAGKSWREVK